MAAMAGLINNEIYNDALDLDMWGALGDFELVQLLD